MEVWQQEEGLLESRHQRAPGLLCCGVAHSWSVYLYAKCHQQIQSKQVLHLGMTLSSCPALFCSKTHMRFNAYFAFTLFCV